MMAAELIQPAAKFLGTPFGALCVLIAFPVGALFWLGLYPIRRWRYRSFPGPLGLPFLGNLPQIAAMDTTHFLSYVSKKYGPICKVWFGTRPWLVVSDPDLVRKLSSQSAMRAVELSSFLGLLTGDNREIEKASCFYAHGEVWRKGRRAFEASIVHPASLAGHLPTLRRVLGRFVPSLSRPASSGAPLDAQKAVGDLILSIVGEMAYGLDFGVDFEADGAGAQPAAKAADISSGGVGGGSGQVGPRLARVCREVFNAVQLENSSAYLALQLVFPSLAPAIRCLADLLPDANQRRSMAANSALAATSRQLMAQCAASADAKQQQQQAGVGDEAAVTAVNGGKVAAAAECSVTGAGGVPVSGELGGPERISASSFMAGMLEGRRRAGAGERLTDIEVIAQSSTFILASFDTSSTTISLALLLLATHPESQARMLAEVDATEGREISPELLAELPYTEAVLKETLRLYPPVPMMHRHAKTDIKLPDGRVIPSGTFLALSSYNLQHDPALWPEPERFRPERFLAAPGPAEVDSGAAPSQQHPAAWAGFGLGARMCVGYKLATMIGKATLLSLLRRYTFSVAPGQALPPRMATGLTYGPQGGVWLHVHAR